MYASQTRECHGSAIGAGTKPHGRRFQLRKQRVHSGKADAYKSKRLSVMAARENAQCHNVHTSGPTKVLTLWRRAIRLYQCSGFAVNVSCQLLHEANGVTGKNANSDSGAIGVV